MKSGICSLLATGLFDLVKIPIYTESVDGELFEPLSKTVTLTWPENYPMERVLEIYQASTSRFFQMYLLDDKAAKGIGYSYRSFPAAEIKWGEWPITTGADPTSSVTGISKGKGTSHYAYGHVYETPYNNLVIGGGYVKKVMSDVGEQALANFSRTHTNLRAVSIESNSTGAASSAKKAIDVGMVARNVGLKIHFHNVSELGAGSKIARQFKFLEPLFSNGILLVAEGPTSDIDGDEFLRMVRSALKRYPNFAEDEPEADVLDCICMAVLDIPRIWTRVHTNVATSDRNFFAKPNTPLSPARQLGSYSYLRG